MKKISTAVVFALCAAATAAHGQQLSVSTAVLFESYSFDPGLSFSKVSELTIPVTATLRFGNRGDLTISTGYARVSVTAAETAETPISELAGVLDAEVRLTVAVVPERLSLIATGTAPTGFGAVDLDDVTALRALATDVVGFAAASLGAGGSVGGGFVAAVPLGRMAIGLAGRYSRPLSYTPVAGMSDKLRPGAEIRVRTGLEGPIGPRTHLRITGILTRRGRDEFNGEVGNGIGNRYAGYVAVDQGVGAASLSLYAFDLFRSGPQLEQTGIGTAIFPRGNAFGAGARVSFAAGRSTQITPKAEFRGSWEAADAFESTLRRKGSSLRFGADLRHSVTNRAVLAVQAEGLTGNILETAETIGFSGYRIAAFLEITR
jgi:hypothetical protein